MRLIIFVLIFSALTASARAATLPDAVTFSVAIERGDTRLAKQWLESGLPPDFEGQTIGTGIMIGAWEGSVAMMEIFLAHGADVNVTNARGEQALLHAAWKGNLNAVRWLVEHGANIDRVGKNWSALHYATFAGRNDVVAYLLDRGANVNALSTNGSTPLMMAAREAQQTAAERLLAAGAKADVANDAGENAVQWAVRNNNLKLAQLIGREDFARLAAAVPQAPAPPPVRSQPVGDSVDRMLAQARRLEAAGKRDEALRYFRAAIAAVRETEHKKTATPAPVAGLTISAKRNNPSQQTAGLRYATPAVAIAAKPVEAVSAPVAEVKTSANPATKPTATTAGEDEVDVLLAKARGLEAAGRQKEALQVFRQAAALLRTR